MVREELYITVPNLFRCPISLDVMKSPVSLTTGVTYDRSSIQTWLDKGNNTCPATMQVLQSKDFVPNHTLQRLIQIWSNSALRRVDSASDSVRVPTLSHEQVRVLIREINKEEEDGGSRAESVSKLVCFARESDENRKFLGKIDGFVAMLVDFIGNVHGGKANFVEQIVQILHLIINDYVDKNELMRMMLKSGRDCLSSLLLVLQQGSLDSRIAAARVLESIAIDAESKLLIAEKTRLLTELMKFLNPETDPNMIESALSCLIAISMPKRIKIKIVQLGVVESSSKLLAKSNSSVSIVEKVLKLLEMVSSVKEGRTAICEDSMCVAAIVGKVLKVSNSITEHGVMILWSVCYLFRDQKAQEAVAKNNGLTKILLLMQSNCSPPVRQMSADLLKIFRVNSKSCLSSYDTKTTHIMPF